jgi:hypothetical protein
VKKLLGILSALVLVLSLVLVTAAPVLAGTIIHVPGDYPTIQAALNVSEDGDTIMVAAGKYDAFVVFGKQDISIIGSDGATVTTADLVSVDVEPIQDAWVMAAVYNSGSINIEGIDFDGTDIIDEQVVVGIAYVDSTGRIADLTVESILGADLGAGVAIIGDADTSAVDLSGITVANSMAGIILWAAEANLDGCTVTGMNPDGGFDIMESGVGIVIGIPGEYWGPSIVEMKGSTISDNDAIGIYICDDSTLEAQFNNIVGNTGYGVANDGGELVGATHNWWGDNSGPYHPTANPGGSGNPVSNDVDFEPWLQAGVVAAKIETVAGRGTVDATDEAGTKVVVDGTATVIAALYEDNPAGPPPSGIGSLGKYVDVYISDTSGVTEVEIRLYYTDADLDNAGIDDESLLQLLWWDGDKWKEYSLTGVNTASNYVWGKIQATGTEPSLDFLEGGFNDIGYESGEDLPGGCGCFIATAAYGTDTAQEIDILREFRDEVLLSNGLGARLASLYYKTSPPIADLISQNEFLRTAVRVGLVDPIVKLLTWTHGLWSP